jgi:large subunit ribosomal protein L4
MAPVIEAERVATRGRGQAPASGATVADVRPVVYGVHGAVDFPYLTRAGQQVGRLWIDPATFGGKVNRQLLHEVVVMYLANQRAGTHSTLRRGEVAGSTKKLFRQKGTGNARVGTRRTNKRKGGGTAKGPKPRDYEYHLPKKAVRAATRMALLSKFADGEAVVVEDLDFGEIRTRHMVVVLRALDLAETTCLVGLSAAEGGQNIVYLSARNLPGVEVLPVSQFNAYTVLRQRYLVLTLAALEELCEGRQGQDAVAGYVEEEPAGGYGYAELPGDPRWKGLAFQWREAGRARGTVREAMTKYEKDMLWSLTRDPHADPERSRALALRCLLMDRDREAPGYILQELERTDIGTAWAGQLLHAVEDVRYADAGQQGRLRQRLLDWATALHGPPLPAPEGEAEQALWAALRRYALLVRAEELDSLLPFLRSPLRGTQQAALQVVEVVFRKTPPRDPDCYPALRTAVAEVLDAHLGRDALREKERAAVCVSAFRTLTVLADGRLGPLGRAFREQAEPWLVQYLGDRVEEVGRPWDAGGATLAADHPARRALRDCLAELRPAAR